MDEIKRRKLGFTWKQRTSLQELWDQCFDIDDVTETHTLKILTAGGVAHGSKKSQKAQIPKERISNVARTAGVSKQLLLPGMRETFIFAV